MHVNISRNAFQTEDHLYRFLRLVTMRPAWAVSMAQRTADQARRWATFQEYSMDTCRSAIRHRSRYLTNHTSVVNICRDRFEFRLPRGTLRIDRFLKNIEWATSMIGFTRAYDDIDSVNPAEYMTWVRDFPTVYANVASYIDEKRDTLNEGLDPLSENNRALAYHYTLPA